MTTTVGSGAFVYQEYKGWGRLPEGWEFGEVADVAVDSRDRLFVLTRGEHPVIILDREGVFIGSWGEGQFVRPHGLFIGSDDVVYTVDDKGHAVRKFTPEGELLMAIDTGDSPAKTGYVLNREDTVIVGGRPFNRPTAIALAADGGFYVSDGYGNARVHRFDREGQLRFSWGEPGDAPGQFRIPHDVYVGTDDKVYVADRMNRRIQVFGAEGEFLTEWPGVRWPNAMCVDADDRMYVAEMGGVFFDWPLVRVNAPPARITVRTLEGRILAELGEVDPLGEGIWFSPHGIAVDSRGDVYVGEAAKSYTKGLASAGWGSLRKYVKI